MKNTIILLKITLLFCLIPSFIFAQNNCSQYYPMSKGIKYELVTYDKKDKKITHTVNEIIDFVNNGSSSKATIETTIKNLKKDKDFTAKFHVTCEGDKIIIDVNDMLQEQMKHDMEGNDVMVEITGTNPTFPNNLEIGQPLPDVKSDIKVSSGSVNFNFHAYSDNRKVVGKEKITTPAGTFNCVVISMDTDVKTILSKSGSSKLWISEGVGTVRQEEYNKSGKLTQYQVLTSFSND